ncbi:MAG TPA: carboxypeptidase-like regulatory domain-containing protein [Flavipsychrobacter sp.]|nr:carboxypeptidase-like regulatory domain-containing protein [Flavipsychrobacter sp.]
MATDLLYLRSTMPKPQPIQISIPQPCHEDWNKMTPTEQGRFCNSCQKCVVDFTGFTDRQLYDFFDSHKGQKVCGRFNGTQLNKTISIPKQPNSLLYSYFIAFGLTLVLIQIPIQELSAKAPLVNSNTLQVSSFHESNTPTGDSILISGYVLDNNKKPIPNANADLIYGNHTLSAQTDSLGQYHIAIPKTYRPELLMLKITIRGYETEVEYYTKENLTEVKTTILIPDNIEERTITGMAEIDLEEYKIPLIDPFNPSNKTFTSDEIEKMPR